MTARKPTRMPKWQEWSVYSTFGFLLATGIAWLALDQWVRVEGDFGPEHHPAENWTLIAHAIGAYAFLVILGAMIPVHIPLGWNRGRNRVSGAASLTLCVLLAVTALANYYVGEDVARSWASTVHWTAGLAALPVILIHVTRNRSRR